MNCKICQQETKDIFNAKILDKYNINYFYCSNCGFLSTEEPYWLDDAYVSAIDFSDTGIMSRNISLSVAALNIIFYFFDYKKKFLDYAGGYGIFVRLMRDIGLDFKWQDNFSQNLLARGFEYSKDDKKMELITAFEVFEHFKDPIIEIEKFLKISKNILFSTELLPTIIPLPNEWWYYGLNHGQHLSFYSVKTFKFIANKYGLNYYTNNKNIHFLTDKKISNLIFKLFTNRKVSLLFWVWAKYNLKSKIWSDHSFLIEK